MPSAREQAGLASYAATRWPAVVRVLVLLGAPLTQARRLAGVAVGRLLDAPSAHDLEAALFAEVVGTWEDDASAWWRSDVAALSALDAALDADLEAVLDRLDPATRARLVLTVVAELGEEQVDEVVVGGGAVPADLGPVVARAAASVEPGPPSEEYAAAGRDSRRRSRRRRTGWVVGVAAAGALVAGGAVVLVDPTEPFPVERGRLGSDDAAQRLPVRAPTILVRGGGDLPADWYDGDFVHVAGPDDATAQSMELVKVGRLQSMTAVQDGVAGVLDDGTVVFVGPDGMQPLGRARGGSTAVGSPSSPGVAWLDVDGDLVVARVPPSVLTENLPIGARLVARDGDRTYVGLRQGHLVVSDDGSVTRQPGPAPLDVAAGTRVVATAQGLRVEGTRVAIYGEPLDLPGTTAFGARLSEDGRYLLTGSASSGSSALSTVVDVASGEVVELPVPDDGRVVDASFDSPLVLTLVLARPDGARFPSRIPRGNGSQPGFDLVTCRLEEGTCEATVRLDAFERAPLVAH